MEQATTLELTNIINSGRDEHDVDGVGGYENSHKTNFSDDDGNDLKRSERSIEIDVDEHNQHSKYVWLHAFYHSVVVCIGTGILGLPHATAYLGYFGMVIVLTFVAGFSLYNASLLIECQSPSEGTYSEVAEAVMGRKFAMYFVRPLQFLQFFLIAPIFILIGAQGMSTMDIMAVYDQVDPDLSEKVWTIVMGVLVFTLSCAPDMSQAWQISLFGFVAAVMIACYSIIGSSVVIARADHRGDSTAADFYGRPPNDDTENPGMGYIMGVLSSFGSVLYAFGYAIVIPDIHASLHDHNTTDSQKDMKKATYSAFMFAYPAYLLAALVGYGAFGATVNDEVLLSLNNYLAPAAMYFIWAFVIIKVSTEAAIFNQCAFTLIRDMVGLTIDHDHVDYHSRNKWIDYMLRFVWLVLTTLIAMFVPVFSDLSSIGASITIMPLSLIVPVILWHKKNEGDVSKKRLIIHSICMIISILFAIMGLTGSVYHLIQLA